MLLIFDKFNIYIKCILFIIGTVKFLQILVRDIYRSKYPCSSLHRFQVIEHFLRNFLITFHEFLDELPELGIALYLL